MTIRIQDYVAAALIVHTIEEGLKPRMKPLWIGPVKPYIILAILTVGWL
ncbi:MAG TPA: hypothetical protein VI542_14395 [Candidatus Tectomicrobia bacterium]